jgi:hypothetical protein
MAALAVCSLLGCAAATARPEPMPVWVRSHNKSPVDVYLLCGDRDARRLGTIEERGTDAFEIPAGMQCVEGFNFFLVVRNAGRGYWVGPVRSLRRDPIQLVIEKYAGLSTVSLIRN